MDWQALIGLQPALEYLPSALRERAKREEVKTGQVLCRVGDRVQSIFAVISGELRLVRRSRNGTEIILQRSRSGFIAEASLNSKTYHCDLVAARKGEIVSLPVRAFRSTLDQNADFRRAWIDQLAREVRTLRAQCERLSLRSAADRITHYIETDGDQGAVELRQSRKTWAAELGISHEALYRTLRTMQAEGKLKLDGARIILMSPRRHR